MKNRYSYNRYSRYCNIWNHATRCRCSENNNNGYNPNDPYSYSYTYTIDQQGNYHYD